MSQINLSNWEIADDTENSRIVIRSKETGETFEINENGIIESSGELRADKISGLGPDELGADVSSDGITVTDSPTDIDFAGSLSVADDGDGTATISVDDAFVDAAGDTMSGDLDMDGDNTVLNLPTPTNPDESATKQYVDALEQGLDIKESVRAATEADIDLSSSTDPNPIDGVTLSDGDRVLLKEQDTARQNGIYTAATAADPSSWTRSEDADEDVEVDSGMFMFVEEGTLNANRGFVLVTDDSVLGSSNLEFTQFSGAGQITAGDNLEKSGDTLNVIDGTGSGLDADILDGEEVDFSSPEDEDVIIYDAEAGKWKEQDPGDTLIQKFDQDLTVTVGPNGDFNTLNEALEALTDQYPQYTQAEGKEGGFTAVVRLLDDFVMQEQVLVDGIHLDWIRIETTRGSDAAQIDSFDRGSEIADFTSAEETVFTFDDVDESDLQVDNTNSDLDGEYVALGTADAAGDSESYYFYFNVTDLTDLAVFNSNAGDPNPNLSGSTVTGVDVDIQLADSPQQVATALQSAIDSQSDLDATIDANNRIVTVTDLDEGIVVQNPVSTNTDKISTSIEQSGAGPDAPNSSEGAIDVTSDSDSYLIDLQDGEGPREAPPFKLIRGEQYQFNLSNSGDPFRLQTESGSYDSTKEFNDGVDVSVNRETGTIVFDVPQDAPNELYYVSENDSDKSGKFDIVNEAPIAEITNIIVADYTVEPFRTTYLSGDSVELQDATLEDYYFWFNLGGNSSDPNLSGIGIEVSEGPAASVEDVATALQTEIDQESGFNASVDGRVVTVENATEGVVDDSLANSNLIGVTTSVQGRESGFRTKVVSPAHSFTAGDRITIRDHNSGIEEVNYNGQFVVRDTNLETDSFELQFSDNPAALFNASRANVVTDTEPEAVSPEPVPVVAEALTQQWEFFYEPAFGVARGSLPTINCVFSMDDSDGQSYQSYYDGLAATDRGHINITPFNGFINAAGSNIYATRSSIINANDAVASGAGRMGVWAYSNSIINARRVTAEDCGLVGASADTGNGFDSQGRPIGNCINATRGSLVNAEGATVGGAQGDNVYASYGGMINLDGHSATTTFTTPSINGQNINIDGGTVTRQDESQFDNVSASGDVTADGSVTTDNLSVEGAFNGADTSTAEAGNALTSDGNGGFQFSQAGGLETVSTFDDLPAIDPPQLVGVEDEGEIYASKQVSGDTFQNRFAIAKNTQSVGYGVHGFGISPDGTKVVTGTTYEEVYEYDLLRPFDFTSAVEVDEFEFNRRGNLRSFCMSNDGRHMYIGSREYVNHWELSTPFDISTRSRQGEEQIRNNHADQEYLRGIDVADGGERFYIAGRDDDNSSNRFVEEYSMNNYRITSINDTGRRINDPGDTTLYGITMSEDGTRFYLADSRRTLYEYELSNPYDFNSESLINSYSISGYRALSLIETGDTTRLATSYSTSGSNMYQLTGSGWTQI